MNTVQLGGEKFWVDSDGNKRLGFRTADDGSASFIRYSGTHPNETVAETIATVSTAGVVTITSANLDLPAGSVATADLADGAVTPVKVASGYRALGDAAAITIAATDRQIQCTATSTATTAVTMTATHAGHVVQFRMIAGDADSVITLAVTGGTITLNAANEGCIIVYSGTAWELVALTGGATIA